MLCVPTSLLLASRQRLSLDIRSEFANKFASRVSLPCLFNCKKLQSNKQEYRSGHNEAVLKTVCLTARGFESLFLRQNKGTPKRCPFCFGAEECSNTFSKLCFEWGAQVGRKSSGSSLTRDSPRLILLAKCIPR